MEAIRITAQEELPSTSTVVHRPLTRLRPGPSATEEEEEEMEISWLWPSEVDLSFQAGGEDGGILRPEAPEFIPKSRSREDPEVSKVFLPETDLGDLSADSDSEL